MKDIVTEEMIEEALDSIMDGNDPGVEALAKLAFDLKKENDTLRKGLEIYERERNRFKHAKPEMTEEQYDEAMYELDDMFLAGEIGYADYIKGFRDLNEKYREGETND